MLPEKFVSFNPPCVPELEDYARQYIKDNVNRPLETSIATIDGNIQEIRDTRSNRSESCRQLEDRRSESRLRTDGTLPGLDAGHPSPSRWI